MKILWNRVFAAALVATVLIIVLSNKAGVALILSSPSRIGPGHGTDEKTLGLLTLGILAVAIVAIVRLLTRGDGK